MASEKRLRTTAAVFTLEAAARAVIKDAEQNGVTGTREISCVVACGTPTEQTLIRMYANDGTILGRFTVGKVCTGALKGSEE